MSLNYFDCNCMIGKRADRRPREPFQLDDLYRDMTDFGIAESLVISGTARDYDPAIGNSELAKLDLAPNLHRVWTVLPKGESVKFQPDQLLSDMAACAARAAIVYPEKHQFSLAGWSLQETLNAIEQEGYPLLIPRAETSWDEVHSICSRHPNMPVVISWVGYRELRYLLPLWEQHPNLYVDSSWFSISNGLEYMHTSGFSRRMLFGTNYPYYTPGAAITALTYAHLPEDVKLSIAGNNLRSILKGVAPA